MISDALRNFVEAVEDEHARAVFQLIPENLGVRSPGLTAEIQQARLSSSCARIQMPFPAMQAVCPAYWGNGQSSGKRPRSASGNCSSNCTGAPIGCGGIELLATASATQRQKVDLPAPGLLGT